jgi:uncharacterized membrane protein YfcA
MVEWTTVWVVVAIFIATLFRSTFGFGEALIAVPLLALFVPVEEVVPLATLVSITVALIVVAQDWHKVHFRSAARLVIATVAGIPLGLWLLTAAPAIVVKAILGVLIIGFASYCLARPTAYRMTDDRWAWAFGLGAGVLGGAYAMNGPPLVVYGSLRRWSPEHFRATLQGYFLPASSIGMCGYLLAGLWTRSVTVYYVWSLAPALIAILMGRAINRRMKDVSFIRYVHVGLILIGAVLLTECVTLFFRQHEADRACFPRPRVERSAERSNLKAEPRVLPDRC